MRAQMPSMPPRGGFPPSGGDDSDEEEGQNFFAGGERRSIPFLIFGTWNLQGLQWALCARSRPARASVTSPCTTHTGNNETCRRVRVDLRTSSALFVFTYPLNRGSRRRFEEEETRSGPFQGAGNRLGDEETPSAAAAAAPEPNAPPEREMETAVRVITFWRNGFTIEDGPLLSYDNPQNAQLLELINSG